VRARGVGGRVRWVVGTDVPHRRANVCYEIERHGGESYQPYQADIPRNARARG